MSPEGALCDRHAPALQLIETLRWEPARGFVRLARHLARLEASAAAMRFAYSAGEAEAALSQAVTDRAAGPPSGKAWPQAPMLRVRLTLDAEGHVAATALPFGPTPPGTVWCLKIARTRLDSSDPLLRHKTTRRAVYDAARAEFSLDQADEVLLLNERGEICEGAITTVFVDIGDGGPLLTPPLHCGLLAGVLRAELLEMGRAIERVLAPGDLSSARAVCVGNSLRGLIRATVSLV